MIKVADLLYFGDNAEHTGGYSCVEFVQLLIIFSLKSTDCVFHDLSVLLLETLSFGRKFPNFTPKSLASIGHG